MKYDYFVSARWRNKPQVEELVNKIRAKGKTVYSFIEANSDHPGRDRDPEIVMKDFESIPDWRNDETVKRIYKRDLDGLKNSKIFVMLLPAGKSAHVEAGIAFGSGKKCILIGDPGKTESLYLIFSESYPAIDDFIASLR
jgi:hypothetical protein